MRFSVDRQPVVAAVDSIIGHKRNDIGRPSDRL